MSSDDDTHDDAVTPMGAERWWQLAIEGWSERHLAVADAAVRRYRALVPESQTARLLHAEILVDLRRFTEASELLEALGSPAQPGAELPVVSAWARLHDTRGALEQAVPWYLRATELEPRTAESWTRLGHALTRLGRLTEAEAVHRHATGLEGDTAGAWLQLAGVLRALDRLEDALDATEQALAQDRTLADAVALRADLEQALRLRETR